MDITILKELINKKYTQNEIGNHFNRSEASVKYWLKKYGLKTLNNTGQRAIVPLCCKCGEDNPNNFYGNDKSMCKTCNNNRVIEKGHENRKYIIETLGGCCKKCGFKDYDCSLDVHHLNPSTKDKNFNSIRGWDKKRIDKEIMNCILLCKNCHTAYHSGYIKLN